MLFIVIAVIILAPFFFVPAVCFKVLSPDAEAHEEANESDSTKDAKCNSFTLGVDMGGE